VNTKTSKDGKVIFNEEDHTYFLGEKQLMSVTTFIGRYKREFKTNEVARNYASKRGLNVADVLAEWQEKGDVARAQGNSIHKIFEDYHNTGVIKGEGKYPKEEPAIKFIEDFFVSGRLVPIESEYIVYNQKYAGQIDCIAINKHKEYFILDWKTNNKIDRESYGGRNMKLKFYKYPDCNFFHYSIQQTMYNQLCVEYDIKECFIVHIGEESYEVLPIEKIDLKL